MQNIEPMTMGSPNNHLSSPGGHGLQHGGLGGTFLPSFLMGDTVQSSPGSRSWLGGCSPPRSSGGSQYRRGVNLPPHLQGLHSAHAANNSRNDSSFTGSVGLELGNVTSGKIERSGAPPSLGLMESFTASPISHTPDIDVSLNQSAAAFQNINQSGVAIQNINQSGVSLRRGVSFREQRVGPNLGRPTETGGGGILRNMSLREPRSHQRESAAEAARIIDVSASEQQLEDPTVTVFGFPPAATSYILEEFSQYGNIVKHIISPSGNWMHIRYQSRLQARKALSKNGKVFGGNMMIGVVPCAEKENGMDSAADNVGAATVKQSRAAAGMRPLAAANSTAAAANASQLEAIDSVPEKNSSVLSKAMGFILGLQR